MTQYSVKQLSKLAGVSVRTLHHYDQIGLLQPAFRSEKGYRFYERKELLQLQQILFYKELDFPLKTIQTILNNPEFNLRAALSDHKAQLQKQIARLELLLRTVDKTIDELKTNEMMSEQEIYEGFSEEQIQAMRSEVMERWGKDKLLATEECIRKLGKDNFQDHKQKGEEINQLLADLMDFPPSDLRVQQTIALHHEHLNFYYEIKKEAYRALGKMYVDDARFTATYDKYRKGLAEFICQAIEVFCDNEMKVN